ncbi:unnamed protein product [Acanthoscelides obtectus]|uniref:Uncharacterized protein n=1 Tax=Acanthoscelides obtectus TaxID=200917 RepID=A0A9P0PLS2_ACAOB|nr:unnamed protein product [Acanthoscelides obtectus]CAK1638844.1 Transmembrane protein 70 homolog, mitochondrial [Acanthoscelides obtectus]
MSLKTSLRLFSAFHQNTGRVCLNSSNSCLLLKNRLVPITCPTEFNIRFTGTTTKNETQVYYGLLTPQIKAVKIFSLSSSIVGIAAQPFLYTAISATGNVPVILAAYSFIGFFTVVTPLLLHSITRNYITHLTYKKDTDTYVARTVSFFCQQVQVNN